MPNYARLGDWNANCDVCGLLFKGSQLRLQWDGARVCAACWSPRHPQELRKSPRAGTVPPFTRNNATTNYTARDWEQHPADQVAVNDNYLGAVVFDVTKVLADESGADDACTKSVTKVLADECSADDSLSLLLVISNPLNKRPLNSKRLN